LTPSHSTVLRRLNDFVEENVLDFKTEGKNKVFYIKKNLEGRNYVYNAERYKIKQTTLKIYPTLAVTIEDLTQEKQMNAIIILFGSYAKFSAKRKTAISISMSKQQAKRQRKR